MDASSDWTDDGFPGLDAEPAVQQFSVPTALPPWEPTGILCGVDNNRCRFEVVRHARAREIWAVFSMLSRDGQRCQVFLQGAGPDDPCLWCALPNLDPNGRAVCARGIITGC